jgi:cytidyltransferase-like protein
MLLVQGSDEPVFLSTRAREVFDVTGAGDTVIAVLAGALASGDSLQGAAALANLAAGLVVRKSGAAAVTPSEIRVALHRRGQGGRGLVAEEELQSLVAEAKSRSETVIMTNGCFDVLHAGHVAYLEEAKSLGDRLIVAVNDDDSVRKLKGESRPIVWRFSPDWPPSTGSCLFRKIHRHDSYSPCCRIFWLKAAIIAATKLQARKTFCAMAARFVFLLFVTAIRRAE